MRRTTATLILVPLLAFAHVSQAHAKKLRIVTTLNVLASIATEIGGDHVQVKSLCKPNQDPHTLVAKPTFKLAAKRADLFIELGLDLDKWATAVTNASGNPEIQTGARGRVIASLGIATKELPKTLSKAWGDIHPYGNPHVWLDPVNMKKLAENIAEGMSRVDPANKAAYDKRLAALVRRIDNALYGAELVAEYGTSKLERLSRRGRLIKYLKRKGTYGKLGGWLKKAERLRGLKIVTYHKTWIYFCDRFGLEIGGEIEEKPGIPPSQTYLKKLIDRIKSDKIRVLFIDSFYPQKDGRYIAGKTGARIVTSPIDVGAEGTRDYFSLIDTLLDRILAAAR